MVFINMLCCAAGRSSSSNNIMDVSRWRSQLGVFIVVRLWSTLHANSTIATHGRTKGERKHAGECRRPATKLFVIKHYKTLQ